MSQSGDTKHLPRNYQSFYIKKMKATLRLPLEQYAFVEIQEEGTPEEIRDAYESLKIAFSSGSGLETKEWNTTLDRYLAEAKMDEEMYAKMSKTQQNIVQEIKRAMKRIIKK